MIQVMLLLDMLEKFYSFSFKMIAKFEQTNIC